METVLGDNRIRTEKKWEDRAPAAVTRWLVISGVLFLVAAVFGGGYAYEQSMAASYLTVQNQSLQSTIENMRNQIEMLTARLNQATAAPALMPEARQEPSADAAQSWRAAMQENKVSTPSTSTSYSTPTPSSSPANSSQGAQSPLE